MFKKHSEERKSYQDLKLSDYHGTKMPRRRMEVSCQKLQLQLQFGLEIKFFRKLVCYQASSSVLKSLSQSLLVSQAGDV